MPTSILDDLYRYNDWANGKILELAEGLTEAQLDEPRAMGFGSLRSTIYHVLMAETIWLERWQGRPWRPLPTEPGSVSLPELASGLRTVSEERRALLDAEVYSGFQRVIEYKDGRQNEHRHPLRELLLHVANHGIHHRAQALHYLKQHGRRLPVGIDYLFYKLAYPSIEQDAAAVVAMREHGMEVSLGTSAEPAWDRSQITRYYGYHDWANHQVLKAASTLDDGALDHDYQMGLGTIRKNLMHLHDVEPWWLGSWTGTSASYVRSPANASLAALEASWGEVIEKRNTFVQDLDQGKATAVVTMTAFGPPKRFRVLESMIQICAHGTHHRAQLVNMLRHSGVEPPAIDYIVYVRSHPPA